ncbi:hypothetical protein N7532_005928 [Penicillium argentinense]|uniref:Beta-glucuronidase C-terminal domain-containing protein n=1 Tax=Penicillium argentinense TaxID=1131581 RepID=A0A9W9KBG4_9EURO|nr:uncharacterized protein N7532_005928 [Penicillium argentinense]KAJ5098927.1 hypothetical protein N7532_005928 [Penicillium argentinense]
MLSFLPWIGVVLLLGRSNGQPHPIAIPSPKANTAVVPKDFHSFSIEFAFFPDYAGNKSHPNRFTKNLLQNFKDITGVYPLVRVGGTSQDHSDYFPDQEENIKLIYEHPDDDQPIQINYGPTFFESYHTLGPIKFLHGLNMNQNRSMEQLQDAAAEACTAIGPQLHLFELGNEWNFVPGEYRAGNYSMLDYAQEWNHKSSIVKAAVQNACPGPFPGFMAPSFVLLTFVDTKGWTAEGLYHLGYDQKNLTKELSFHKQSKTSHNCVRDTALTQPENLMNHTKIVENLSYQIKRSENLAYLGHPFTLGEMNSIAGQGRTGETNVFGDALWMVDFSLWAAAHNIKRLHLHQGLNYRYASWQPILSKGEAPATKPPYYGQVMVAAALGDSEHVRVMNIPLKEDTEAAYAIYDAESPGKIVAGSSLQGVSVQGSGHHRHIRVERLIAPGSDSTTNVTFGGVSYDYELKHGKPVTVNHEKEVLEVRDGVVSVEIPASSAVLLSFS